MSSDSANPNSPAPSTISSTSPAATAVIGPRATGVGSFSATRPPQLRQTSWRGSTGSPQ